MCEAGKDDGTTGRDPCSDQNKNGQDPLFAVDSNGSPRRGLVGRAMHGLVPARRPPSRAPFRATQKRAARRRWVAPTDRERRRTPACGVPLDRLRLFQVATRVHVAMARCR